MGKRKLDFPPATPAPILLLARRCLRAREGRPSTAALVQRLKELQSKGRKRSLLLSKDGGSRASGVKVAVEMQAASSVSLQREPTRQSTVFASAALATGTYESIDDAKNEAASEAEALPPRGIYEPM